MITSVLCDFNILYLINCKMLILFDILTSLKSDISYTLFLMFYLFWGPLCAASVKHKGFPCGSAGKECTCNAGDLGSISGLGRSRGERKGYPLQYSGLENSIDCTVHGVAKSWTQLSDFHFP